MNAPLTEDTSVRRVQLKRSKGWRMPPNTIKVCRPSIWGNPFNATQSGLVFPWTMDGAPIVHLLGPPSVERCIDLYTAHLHTLLVTLPNLLAPLRGKNLACWCALDQPCHADVLLRLAPYRFEEKVVMERFKKGEHGIKFPQRVQ
jgi:hypothetical protein